MFTDLYKYSFIFLGLFFGPPIITIILMFFNTIVCSFYYRTIKHMVPKKPSVPHLKKDNIFKRLLIMFPKRLSLDLIERDPDSFDKYGIHLVCGEQGSGKTTTVCYLLQEWRRKYPLMQIYTNMDYKYQDRPLVHWREMLTRDNGIYGVAEVIDEIQTWFSSVEWKDFPPTMLQEISQQRKQRKCIVGTAQVFSRIAKPLREQVHFVYLPITILGCLTIVRRAKAGSWNEEKQKFTKYDGLFFFVHTKELRDSFDTYKKIAKYKDTDFTANNFLNSNQS